MASESYKVYHNEKYYNEFYDHEVMMFDGDLLKDPEEWEKYCKGINEMKNNHIVSFPWDF